MIQYCLDSSVIVNYLRGKVDQVTFINELDGELVASVICLAELYDGALRARNVNVARQGGEKFFLGLDAIYPIDERIARAFGQLRADLRTKGNVLADMDLLIAATCLAYNLILVTANIRHFSRVKNLEILDSRS